MHSLSFSSSLLPPSVSTRSSPRLLSLQLRRLKFDTTRLWSCSLSPTVPSFPKKLFYLLCRRPPSASATTPSEGAAPVVNVEDFYEKDWSFLESMETGSSDHAQKIERIVKAGEISESSRVLVSIGSEAFIDHLMESSPSQLLLVVHDSLFVLACVKEKYDKVKCWQGELTYVPEKWSPLDVVFLYFLPALPFSLDEILKMLSERCSPGARIVISHPQGRKGLEEQRQKQDPDHVVVSELPDSSTLQTFAKKHSFEVTKFVDEPGLYLAVLKFSIA
ncbi:PREDICTED: uncharacterized protein LOC104824483 [Tarenaya hassleriana]|uniref:uncharacterized protein LOC104824483 n=1 Tax=Tarenaya hassleriana TaxID=28532 RepID=UPI00053C905D|nr:PREDICTED: uncharacterized protein LOC104824483 [Tarenaya hassleriana]XP_010554890.1 PREDICTED: uncharacterized protein LOC104824483 [Tarenaya hassleriana]